MRKSSKDMLPSSAEHNAEENNAKCVKICVICLRCDKPVKKLKDKVEFFYEELSNFSWDQQKNVCADCFDNLKQCYEFSKQCEYASKILKEWYNNEGQKRGKITELYQKLELHNFDESDSEIDTDGVLTDEEDNYLKTINLKKEIDDSQDINYDNDSYQDMDDAEYLIPKIETSDSDEDTIKSFKVEKRKRNVKRVASDQRINDSISQFTDVFDIKILRNHKEVMDEFAQRKYSDHYLNANYKCDICYTVYSSQKFLDFHKKWHDPSRGNIVCNVCSMRFNRVAKLKKHKNASHLGRFACKICPLVTYRRSAMIEHYKIHTGCEFKCDLCTKVFRNQTSLRSHQRTLHGTSHVCSVCARSFISELGLKQHYNQMHQGAAAVGEDGVRCEQCNIAFINKQVYETHVNNSPKHRNPPAVKDGKTKRSLEKHNKLCCIRCGLQCDNESALRDHKKSAHPSVVSERTCKLCNKRGNFRSWIYHHMLKEHPEVPYKPPPRHKKFLCTQCGKGFKAPSVLAQHENIHKGVRPFSCELCPKSFRSKELLRHHEQIHKPPSLACKVCDKKFVRAANLNRHMEKHTKEKGYQCKLCGKKFKVASALLNHVRVHLNMNRRKLKPTRQYTIINDENSETSIMDGENSEMTVVDDETSEMNVIDDETSEMTVIDDETSEMTIIDGENAEMTVIEGETSEVFDEDDNQNEYLVKPEDEEIILYEVLDNDMIENEVVIGNYE